MRIVEISVFFLPKVTEEDRSELRPDNMDLIPLVLSEKKDYTYLHGFNHTS